MTLWTLLSVALGGAIGLAGSWLIEWMKEKNERRKKRAEKLEELVSAVHEFDHWLDRYRNIKAYGDPGEEVLSPMSKVQAIGTVHFPELLERITALDIEASRYQVAIGKAAQKRLAGKISEMNEGLLEAREPYMRKRHELLDELKKFAGKELTGGKR